MGGNAIPFQRIVGAKKSIFVAADVESKKDWGTLRRATSDIGGISGFKFGFTLGLRGLEKMAESAKDSRQSGEVVCIYDHQKAGNDIPDMGAPYARTLASCGIDAGIIFPFAGPATQENWTLALQDAGLQVIVGGVMTHEKFLVSEGGYISDDAPERIYRKAAKMGVRHFVVPGNKLNWVKKIRVWLNEELGAGNYVLMAPGFITQGGDISECGQVAGDEWHAIVGSGIYGRPINTQRRMREAALALSSKFAA